MSQHPEDGMSLSESPSAVDWASIPNTVRAPSSQESRASMETHLESPNPDDLQRFLGSSWASYLNAQHSSRELGTMRKTVDEHTKQINTAIICLKQDTSYHQRLAATATAEYKAMRDTVVSDLEKLKHLEDNLLRIQQEVRSSNERTSAAISNLMDELAILQKIVEVVGEIAAQDTKVIHEKYRSALEKIEFLQGEIRQLREDKVDMSKKLFTLENRADTLAKIRQELPPEMTSFLGHIFSQREKLMGLLDQPNPEVSHPTEGGQANQEIIVGRLSEPEYQIQNDIEDTASVETTPSIRSSPSRKRKASESPPREQAPSTRQDFPALLTQYRNKYKANPPSSDAAFIWAFLDDIEDTGTSRHIQESLPDIIPAYVGGRRGLRHKDVQHHVNISDAITWKDFYTALRKIPPRK
ncbi:hypothetical protein B0H67DRAFT_638987 [Lasiosphaeris hirsuta]|uniref:Uncharacterized protein n=1 Tax=Lasiosphaeris hirsuta TaxID=260670 RepID=A0AA40EAU9_9PEZI|nr:hypothetical protein B0H67DRAFT_638987 [Lasiosphaeris hirsuta]